MNKEEEILGLINGFKAKGSFWRLLSLAQIPVLFFLVLYMIARYIGADTIVHVADIKSLEDTTVKNIPDKEFVNIAESLTNLIGTYQPTTAREQFETAGDFFLEQALPNFDELQMTQELSIAEESDISQVLFVDHHSVIRREDGSRKVCLYGARQKVVDRQALPQQDVTYCFVLTPNEPFEGNPFGLMVSEFSQRLGPQPRAAIPRKVTPKFEQPKDPKKKRSSRRKKSSKN